MLLPANKAYAYRTSGEWVFVDIGFSRNSRSCGVAVGDAAPIELRFSDMVETVLRTLDNGAGPANLLIEAPLSVAFAPSGNPTGRSVEKRGSQTRFWYVGLGCAVLTAATYLVRSIYDSAIDREVRLFEGFASFKKKGVATSHSGDVERLRDIAWGRPATSGRVFVAEELLLDPADTLRSAFAVAGMDLGVPPVVVVESDV